VLTWIFLASYYFAWGANEPSISITTIDESGWVPEGGYARQITQPDTPTIQESSIQDNPIHNPE